MKGIKRLLLIASVAFTTIAQGQDTVIYLPVSIPSQVSTYRGGTGADSLVLIPYMDTTRAKMYGTAGAGAVRVAARITVNPADGLLYWHDGAKWRGAGGDIDSNLLVTVTRLADTAEAIRTTVTIQTATDNDSLTTNGITARAMRVNGFGQNPGGGAGGYAYIINREFYRELPDNNNYITNSARGYKDQSLLTILNSGAGYASYDANPIIYGDTAHNLDHIVSFQARPIWDYPAGSTLRYLYGFASTLTPKTGSVGKAYDYYASAFGATGTPSTTTDHYAYFAEDFNTAHKAVNNWGLYINGASTKNYIQGSLGIGTNAPETPLHVYKTGGGDLLRVQSNATVNVGFKSFYNVSGSRKGYYGFGGDGPANDYFSIASGAGIVFITGNVERGAWTTAGNLGIGTTAASEKLEVNGNMKTAAPTASGAGAFKIGKILTGSDTNKYWEVEIDGVDYYIRALTALP